MTAERPLLTAAIIVKNEAEHLRRCLASLRGLCDSIVVVDTGSTDDTVDVARAHEATVLTRPWDGDFSAARNTGLDAIDAQWILYVDADEEVLNTDVGAVRSTLATSSEVVGYLVEFAAHVGFTPYREHRIWRHRPDVRFRGKIHETVVPDLRRIVREEAMRFEPIDLFVQHYGYEGDQTAKHERNLPMLLQQVEAAPERVYLWNHLGRVYDGLGRPGDAEEAWQQGISNVREHGLREEVDILVYGSMSMHLLRNGRDATEVIDEGLALDDDHWTLLVAKARQLMADKEWEAATVPLLRVINEGRQQGEHPVLAYSRSMIEQWPWEMLADCRFELGEYADAAECYERAANAGADELEMRSKAAACRTLATVPSPAGGNSDEQ